MCSNKLALRLKEQIEAIKGGVTATATHLGKSRNTIYNWIEKGNAPLDQVEKLSEIGVDLHYILTGTAQSELNQTNHPRRSDTINETALNYKESNTSASTDKANSLDHKLGSIVDNYINDDVLMMIDSALIQMLNNKNITIDDHKKSIFINAAQKGYEQLAAAGRTEKFSELLSSLINATLDEENN